MMSRIFIAFLFFNYRRYLIEIFGNNRKYISGRRSGPFKFVFLTEEDGSIGL